MAGSPLAELPKAQSTYIFFHLFFDLFMYLFSRKENTYIQGKRLVTAKQIIHTVEARKYTNVTCEICSVATY